MRKYHFLPVLMFIFICFSSFTLSFNKNTAYAEGVSEIAMELNSGTVLHEKNADKQLPMASTTKILTALIICEDCDLDEVITVPDEAVGVEGSSIYLKSGEEISVIDLLYGLMLRSGNDAACALAIHHSGSVEKFIDKMNERAEEIGVNCTHFSNPSGLPNDSHYTTARDLCNIARAAMQNEVFAKIVSTKNYTGIYRSFTNKNRLLGFLDGANGVKTGYTEKAGRCLVSSAKRNNFDIICVVLNCYDMFERSTEIIENCYNEYDLKVLSASKIFNYKGTLCALDKDVSLVIRKDCLLDYKLLEPTQKSACAKLDIYNQNDLIFSGNLFNIK